MALRVWLPLINDYANYGVSGVTATVNSGAMADGGKLGAKSWHSTGNNGLCVPYTWTGTNQMTIAVWVKPNSASAWSSIFGWGNPSNNDNRVEPHNTNANYYYFGSSNSIMATSSVAFTNVPTTSWSHFAMTADGSKVRYYLNGVKTGEFSQSNTVDTSFGGNYKVYFGGFADYYNGYFNDARIYDHALSQKEIRELAKGMAIHYTLDDQYATGRTNFYSGVNAQGSSASSTFTKTKLANEDGYNYKLTYTGTGSNYWPSILFPGNDRTKFTAGKTYIWSAKVRVNTWTAGSMALRNSIASNDYTNGSVNVATTALADGQWHQYTRTKVLTEGMKIGSTFYYLTTEAYEASTESPKAYMSPRVEFYCSNLNGNGTVYDMDLDIKEVQLIEADTFPGFIDNSMVTSTVRDNTGRGNDGTVSSAPPTLITGSPRNSLAWKFNSGTYVSYTMPVAMEQVTWTAWVDFTNVTSGYSALDIVSNSPSGNLWLAINTESSKLWLYRGGVYNKVSGTTTGWHHVALTFNAGVTQWYLDGAAAGSAVDMSAKGTTWPAGSRSLGDSYTGTNWGGTPFLGSVSDFRIYSTVLSADDIKRLYNAPISIANTGVGFASQFNETGSKASFRKTGVALTTCITESVPNIDRTEPDGSKWMRVVHHGNPTTYKFASTDPFGRWVYKDDNRFFLGQMCDFTDRWEFMVEQKADGSATTYKYRWVQTKNPNKAVFADVASANVTKNTSTGYTSFSTGGIYKFNSSTYYCTNNGTSGNWWGAIGAWNAHNGGIPGWAGTVVKDGGYIDLYLRVDGGANWKNTFSIMKSDKSLVGSGMDETA